LNKQATREAYGKALLELGKVFDNVVVLDADLSKSTKTVEFAKQYPERFFNAGIAEQNMMGMAAGLATAGKVVYASSFAIFAVGRAFEQVRNSIAYARLNVKICATHAGLTVGEDGGSHQAIEDIALMRSVPNMSVIVPSDAISTKEALFQSYDWEGPVYIRLGRTAVPEVYSDKNSYKIGKGIELRSGQDITIIACGIMVHKALEAADQLEKEGVNASVIDMHTIKPIDRDLIIKKATETKAIITAEEHNIIGGLGSAVCEIVSESHPIPVIRMGINDLFGQSGQPEELLQQYNLTVDKIVQNAHKILKN